MAQSCYFESPYGWLQLSEDDAGLTACHFLSDEEEPVLEGPPSGQFLPQAAEELAQYFAGERESFDIPLSFHGTEFQNAVWKAACKIPYATTCTYQDIAAAVGNFRAAHAVGTAMRQCPLSFFVPCQRVRRKNSRSHGQERRGQIISQELKFALFRVLREKGAALTGVADLTGLAPLPVGVSVAVPVPAEIVRSLQTAPTLDYYHSYYALNGRLNDIVTKGTGFLTEHGFQAYGITTDSVSLDRNRTSPLPHKTAATRAGLGWIGKSCLLVTKKFGSAVRLSTLLTDAPLPPDTPIRKSFCGSCRRCVDACPGHALRGALWSPGIPRSELLDWELCRKTQLHIMEQATGIHQDLCGKCFAVCPYTQKYIKKVPAIG